jgi:DNA-binding transcriptional ArsR family regulator
MSLLPSTNDVSGRQEGDVQVLGVSEDKTANVFEVLSSETARCVLAEIYDDPAPPSELAARLDLSLQNVSYHIENLEDADIIQTVDTWYSEKGKEMNVYAPADDPVVVFIGTHERKSSFLDLLKNIFRAIAVLLLIPLVLSLYQSLGSIGAAGPESPNQLLPSIPGLEFFLGGLFVLGLVIIWWVWNRHAENGRERQNRF